MTLIALALAAVLAGDPDTVKVTLDFDNAPLSEVLESITLISQVPIELDDAAKKKIGDLSKEKISMKLQNTTVTGAARLIFTPRGLDVKVVDKQKIVVTVTP
jgi:hypothetical protein